MNQLILYARMNSIFRTTYQQIAKIESISYSDNPQWDLVNKNKDVETYEASAKTLMTVCGEVDQEKAREIGLYYRHFASLLIEGDGVKMVIQSTYLESPIRSSTRIEFVIRGKIYLTLSDVSDTGAFSY